MLLLDWIVLGAFVLAMVVFIVLSMRSKDKTSADYFLAGRDATWVAIGASIFASNIGSEHLVGLAGAGASSGMAMAHWEMHGWLILLLGWLFVPFYSRSGVFTMPEFLEKRYNKESRSVLSIISLVSYVLTKVAVTVYAGGVVFKDVFGIESIMGIDFFWISAIGLVLITGLYTTFGGMKAVLWTSVLQTPVLLAGSIAVLIAGLIKVGGWDELMHICRAVPVNEYGDTMTQLIRSPKDAEFPWTGVLLGSAIIGFWYWCTDQYIVQRVLSGRDQTQARRGAIFGGALKLTPVFIFLIPGMIAYALNQQGVITLASSDSAFSTLVKELLPMGFKGLVVGGILAALMSSLASLFNSSATLFTIDFYQKYKPNASEAQLVSRIRIAHGQPEYNGGHGPRRLLPDAHRRRADPGHEVLQAVPRARLVAHPAHDAHRDHQPPFEAAVPLGPALRKHPGRPYRRGGHLRSRAAADPPAHPDFENPDLRHPDAGLHASVDDVHRRRHGGASLEGRLKAQG